MLHASLLPLPGTSWSALGGVPLQAKAHTYMVLSCQLCRASCLRCGGDPAAWCGITCRCVSCLVFRVVPFIYSVSCRTLQGLDRVEQAMPLCCGGLLAPADMTLAEQEAFLDALLESDLAAGGL